MKKILLEVFIIVLLCSCYKIGTVTKVKAQFSNSVKASMMVKVGSNAIILTNVNQFVGNKKVKEGNLVKFRKHKILKIVAN